MTGCSSGQGMMLACNSLPGVLCGFVQTPQDAFLFGRINGGNAVSLPLAASFVYSYNGSLCSASMGKDSFASIWMALYGGGIEGTDCQTIIKIDNIRIVPNK